MTTHAPSVPQPLGEIGEIPADVELNEELRKIAAMARTYKLVMGKFLQLFDQKDVVEIKRLPDDDGHIWIRRLTADKGMVEQPTPFQQSEAEAKVLTQRIAYSYQRTFNEDHPLLKAVMPVYNLRFTAMRTPLTNGHFWTVRRKIALDLTLEDYLAKGQMTQEMYDKILRSIRANHRFAIVAPQSTGKALDLDTPLLTPNGWVRMGDIALGDTLVGRDGQPTKVIGVYPQGELEAFRVTFTDGSTIVCSDDHLWAVRTHDERRAGRGFTVKRLREIRESHLTSQGYARYEIPLMEPADLPERDLPLDPFVLGAFLGDGNLKRGTPVISSADEPLLDDFAQLLPTGTEVCHDTRYDYRIRATSYVAVPHPCHNGGTAAHRALNPVEQALVDLGLAGLKSHEKFVPCQYLFGSLQQRWSLLHGLMDTDGVAHRNGNTVFFSTTSPQLAKDVQFLVQSLGGLARIVQKATTYTYRAEIRPRRLSYVVSVRFNDGRNAFRLERKRAAVPPRKLRFPRRKIASIEPLNEKRPMQCIAVDALDHLYVANDCIVTHNTVFMAALLQKVTEIFPDTFVVLLEDVAEIELKHRNVLYVTTYDDAGYTIGSLIPILIRSGAASLSPGEVSTNADGVVEAFSIGVKRTSAFTVHGEIAKDAFLRLEEIHHKEQKPVVRTTIQKALHRVIVMDPNGPNGLPYVRSFWRVSGRSESDYNLVED